MKLSSLLLSIKNEEETLAYYISHLGMKLENSIHTEHESRYILRFPNHKNPVSLELRKYKEKVNLDEVYEHSPEDNYWKYSLFVDDIQSVYTVIEDKYLSGKPYQFGDIGYLLHTKDPNMYQIEYIQKHFKQNTVPTLKIDTFPLKEIPVFGLITLRTKDPIKSIKFYETFSDLKFKIRMYVDRGNGTGFTLYFLGSDHLDPPNISDPDAIENREWMYQQKETFIELQYYWNTEYPSNFSFNDQTNNKLGFKGIVFETKDLDKKQAQLHQSGFSVKKSFDDIDQRAVLKIESPDKHPIFIKSVL